MGALTLWVFFVYYDRKSAEDLDIKWMFLFCFFADAGVLLRRLRRDDDFSDALEPMLLLRKS